jgi:hypothetical protein
MFGLPECPSDRSDGVRSWCVSCRSSCLKRKPIFGERGRGLTSERSMARPAVFHRKSAYSLVLLLMKPFRAVGFGGAHWLSPLNGLPLRNEVLASLTKVMDADMKRLNQQSFHVPKKVWAAALKDLGCQ